MSRESISSFTIIDGQVKDNTYEYDAHCFFEGKVLRVLLVVPGIIGESIQVNLEGKLLKLRAHFNSEYTQIFKARLLELEKTLPNAVLKNVLVANYSAGILELKLIRDFSSE